MPEITEGQRSGDTALPYIKGLLQRRIGSQTVTTSKIVLGREGGKQHKKEFKSMEMVLNCEYSVVVEEAEVQDQYIHRER